MNVFAIGDLHLPGAQNKSMDVFGPKWEGHADRIAADWDARVRSEDLVLVPGDISWAMRLPQAEADLVWLAERPGSKVLIRGNHDYWWQSIKKVREALDATCHALQNDVLTAGNGCIAVAGARLWSLPGIGFGDILDLDSPGEQEGERVAARDREADEKIVARELHRLGLSLAQLPEGPTRRLVMLHFPPTASDLRPTAVTDLLERHNIEVCVFAHLHNVRDGARFEGEARGVRYMLVSSDYLGFRLAQV